MGWFVGWIEKGAYQIIVAHYIEDALQTPGYDGPRAREAAKGKLLRIIESFDSDANAISK